MANATERTTFTRDVQGRYLCNTFEEAEAWRSAGGKPFDIIVVGGGTFGSAIAEHIWFRQRQAGRGLRTLVVDTGLFTVPEHVQNTGVLGFADPATAFLLDENLPQAEQQTAAGNWRVLGIETSRGFLELAATGVVVIALGTIESARLALLSFGGSGLPTVPLVGKNLMAHLRSNLVVRVPRGAIPGLAGAANELQTAALFVKGRATRPNGDLLGRFHFQISASGGGTNVGAEDELWRKVPDIDFFDQLRTSTDTHVAIAIRGLGEMEAADFNNVENHASRVALDTGTDEHGKRRAVVTLAPTARDQDMWNAMDAAMQKVAAVFANGQPMQVIQNNRDGLGTTHHEAGTLWMGNDSSHSVTGDDGRFHHVENLYAAGPCLFPSIGSPNPMLTGIALARRTGDRIVAPLAIA